jgi:hypothetical protein
MGSFSYSHNKANVEVESRPDGSTVIKTTPRDFKSDGAAEVSIDRSRGDDGSITVVVSPKPPAVDE